MSGKSRIESGSKTLLGSMQDVLTEEYETVEPVLD
jgi:hypothetical protein